MEKKPLESLAEMVLGIYSEDLHDPRETNIQFRKVLSIDFRIQIFDLCNSSLVQQWSLNGLLAGQHVILIFVYFLIIFFYGSLFLQNCRIYEGHSQDSPASLCNEIYKLLTFKRPLSTYLSLGLRYIVRKIVL